VVEGLGPFLEKNHFTPKSDKFGCIVTQFLTGRKHRQTTETTEAFGHGFYGSIAKRQKECKIIQKFTVRPKEEAVAPSSPMNTPLLRILCRKIAVLNTLLPNWNARCVPSMLRKIRRVFSLCHVLNFWGQNSPF